MCLAWIPFSLFCSFFHRKCVCSCMLVLIHLFALNFSLHYYVCFICLYIRTIQHWKLVLIIVIGFFFHNTFSLNSKYWWTRLNMFSLITIHISLGSSSFFSHFSFQFYVHFHYCADKYMHIWVGGASEVTWMAICLCSIPIFVINSNYFHVHFCMLAVVANKSFGRIGFWMAF